MPILSPALTSFLGCLIVAVIGLFCWNLRLRRLLRAARASEAVKDAVPLPPAPSVEHTRPPVAVESIEPIAAPPVKTALLTKLAECEAAWQHRLVQADHQVQAVQQELAALSYSVSHDLRAPLRAIDGFSQALAEDYSHALDATAQGYLQRVRANTRLMASLIEDLLSLSGLARAPMHREWVEMGPVAESVVAGLRKIDPDRAVTLEIQPGLRAFADCGLLEVILRQLLGNAWKFTSRRPSAHVSLRGVMERRETGDSEWVYEVRDDGAGFDMNYAGKLFGAFQRMHTSEEFSGNGIGLAAVQRVVRRHGGRVWAEAVPDQGTAIFFTLGAVEAASVMPVSDLILEGVARLGGASDAAPLSVSSSPAL